MRHCHIKAVTGQATTAETATQAKHQRDSTSVLKKHSAKEDIILSIKMKIAFFALFGLFFATLGGTNAQAPPPPCQSIADIVCNTPGFGTLCRSVKAAGLFNVLTNQTFTLFAPTDDAFAALPKEGSTSLPTMLENNTLLTNLVLFHGVSGRAIRSGGLKCSALLYMANGLESRTVCQQNGLIKNQKGAGNARDKMPIIVTDNVKACNGVVHAVSQVMLP